METYFKRVAAQTPTRFWINNVTREQARMAIEAGACGCTQNPSYTWKMMQDPVERPYVMALLDQILAVEPDDNQALILLQKKLVENIAEIFMPIYEQTNGAAGYVSIQGDPFDESTETILRCAISNTEKYPNLMAKVPVIESGLLAIEQLIAKGIPINATEIMAVRQALDVARINQKVSASMVKPPVVKYSVITGIFDQYIQQYVASQHIDISSDVVWHAGLTVAKKIYAMMKGQSFTCGFIGGGARGLHHFTEMVGADAVITINWDGTAKELIEQNPVVIQRFHMPTPHSVEDELVEKVDEFRRAYFVNGIEPTEYEHYGPVVLFRSSFETAWNQALNEVRIRRSTLS